MKRPSGILMVAILALVNQVVPTSGSGSQVPKMLRARLNIMILFVQELADPRHWVKSQFSLHCIIFSILPLQKQF